MNTRVVDWRTLLALLALEAGLALPIISLPSQGDRVPGVAGPLWLLALMPLGFLAVQHLPSLRDPSWRLLTAIGAALVARALVASGPGEDLGGGMLWLGHNVVPAAIGVALWWRGGALRVAELTPGEVRAEVTVVALCSLATLALVRPFVLADQVLLGAAVGLVVVGGLLAAAFARQDAAEVAGSGGAGRGLGATTALVPVATAVALVSVLQPSLLGAMWLTLARILELLLMPLGWFFAWLGSLFPPSRPAPLPTLPPRPPPPDFVPDPAALAELQDRIGWIGTVILIALVLMVALAAMLAANLLLANWIRPPAEREAPRGPALTVERSGAAGADAQALLAWLIGWLRRRVGARRGSAGTAAARRAEVEASADDAWGTYRRLLEWAARQGVARRPAETTGQLETRLIGLAPHAADTVGLVTAAYEADRYGSLPPPPALLRRLRAALEALPDPPG